MAAIRTFLFLAGALAVLWLGAAPPVAADAPPLPCHAESGTVDAGHHSPGKAMKAMSCCVACTAPALPVPPISPATATRPALPSPVATSAMPGHIAAPEPGPPKA